MDAAWCLDNYSDWSGGGFHNGGGSGSMYGRGNLSGYIIAPKKGKIARERRTLLEKKNDLNKNRKRNE